MAKIFHIMDKAQWHEVKNNEYYVPESLNTDGFIHCSKADQILEVANRLFKGKPNLVILKIREADIQDILKYETPLETPQLPLKYPHIYGPLNTNAIEKAFDLHPDENGTFKLPKNLLKTS